MIQPNKSIEHLAAHALATLPDSIMERRNILSHIIGSLPKNHAIRFNATAILRHLTEHERLQENFIALLRGGSR